MVGEDPDSIVAPDVIPLSFTHKHVFKRILIVAAGPIFNLLLAVIIFYGIFQTSGVYILQPSIGKVKAGSPAEIGGLKKGDLIVAIDSKDMESWDEMSEVIKGSNGNPMTFSVDRNGELFVTDIRPKIITGKNIFGEDQKRYVIGITASGDFLTKDLNPFQAIGESVIQTYRIAKLTIVSIIKLIQGTVSTKTLGGPIMIAEMAGQQAKEGIVSFIFFIALLSINLAILNFLPIPVLDGGHLLFFFIEAVFRRPVNTRMREIAQQVGIFILILLMAFVFYNDISRIFFS